MVNEDKQIKKNTNYIRSLTALGLYMIIQTFMYAPSVISYNGFDMGILYWLLNVLIGICLLDFSTILYHEMLEIGKVNVITKTDMLKDAAVVIVVGAIMLLFY